jgi:hypothetical protein
MRPDAITIELTDQYDRRLDLETDFAIMDDADSWNDPDCARIALTRTTSLGPEDLTDLIIDAVFSPSDDSDADSYDTQETRCQSAFNRDPLSARKRDPVSVA